MVRPPSLTVEQERKLFSMLWRINDCLHHDHNGCRFDGSSNDIDDFREMLHRIDPLYQRQKPCPRS